ncbi:MAG: Hint domain-containing protein [Pseudomonadota bacterium]
MPNFLLYDSSLVSNWGFGWWSQAGGIRDTFGTTGNTIDGSTFTSLGSVNVDDDDGNYQDPFFNPDTDQLLSGNTVQGIVSNVDSELEETYTLFDGTNTIEIYLISAVGGVPAYGFAASAPIDPTATYTVSAGPAVNPGLVSYSSLVMCFCRGTFIKTLYGNIRIEELKAGDLVWTKDRGYQPIRWIGSSKHFAVDDLAPIKFKAGSIGNKSDLSVSPQHRMLVSGWKSTLLFGEDEVLVPAKMLVNDTTIVQEVGGVVDYFHMLFDQHEIVRSEGVLSESFYPGAEGMSAAEKRVQAEIYKIFPELIDGDFSSFGPLARRTLKQSEANLIRA